MAPRDNDDARDRLNSAWDTAETFRPKDPEDEPDLGRLKLVMFDEIKPRLTSNYIVKGLLEQGQMGVCYGESGCGKTFWMLDLSLHIAAGKEWRGRRVRQGGVVYVAAEGGHGIDNRVVSFKRQHDIGGKIPFAAVPCSVDLLNPDADTGPLIELIKVAAKRFNMPVKLVVIDTLSRAMAGGNENAPDDMGAYVMNVDRIREATGVHAMSVHHCGKDSAKGARGHSLLRAATDTEIEVVRDSASKVATARITKQKELPTEGEFSFQLESVELGEDEDGDPVRSCIVVDADCPPVSPSRPRLSPNHQTALDLLQRAVGEGGEKPPPSNHVPMDVLAVRVSLWRSFCYAGQISTSDDPETKKKAFKRASDTLAAKHLIGIWGDWVWIVGRGTERDTKGHIPPVSPGSGGGQKGTHPFKGCPSVSPCPSPKVEDELEAAVEGAAAW